jgi:hypothetical protein
MESSDIEDIKDAVAKVIHEMELATRQQRHRGEGGSRREEAAVERDEECIGDPMERMEQQWKQQRKT